MGHKVLFFTIILIEILAGAEIDLFTPSFPQLQEVFNLSPFEVELTLSVNLVAYCFMCIAAGHLGDRYGRRPFILSGLILFIAGSALCAFASSFYVLLVGRVLEGIGMAGPATLSYIVISDCFSVEEQQKKMGTMNGIISFSMGLAPLLGSYLTLWFHWKANFYVLLGLGVVAFLLAYLYLPVRNSDPAVRFSFQNYYSIFKSQTVLLFIIFLCCMSLVYWVFVGIAPLLYMEDLGVSLNHFGYYQGSLAGVFGLISFISPTLLNIYGQKKCLIFSLSLLVIFAFGCLILFIVNTQNPLIITGVMLLMSMGIIYPCNLIWPLFLNIMPEAKSRLAGCFMALRMIMTAVILQLITYTYAHNVRPTALALFVIIILGFYVLYYLNKRTPLFRTMT